MSVHACTTYPCPVCHPGQYGTWVYPTTTTITWPSDSGVTVPAKPKNLEALSVNNIVFDVDDIEGLSYDPVTQRVTVVMKVWSITVDVDNA